MSVFSTTLLGLLFGLRHALDPDHLVAVSTLAAEERSLARSLWIGAWWGMGHALTLITAAAIILGARLRLPASSGDWLEIGVGALLIVLGVNLLRKLRRDQLHAHAHDHGSDRHVHFHRHAGGARHDHGHEIGGAWRPFLVGAVHGLAGSAALVLVVIGSVRGPAQGLLYVAAFGLGSTGGMALVTLALGLFFRLTTRWLGTFDAALRASAGTLSAALGAAMVLRLV